MQNINREAQVWPSAIMFSLQTQLLGLRASVVRRNASAEIAQQTRGRGANGLLGFPRGFFRHLP
jgi:hypothetical protein